MRKQNQLRLIRAITLAAFLGSAGSALAQAPAQQADDLQSELSRDLTVAQRPIYDIPHPEGIGRIRVDAWVDRPDHIYSIGQPLRVMVRPHQNAYLTVVDVGSSGRVTVLFPNFLQQNSRVEGGTVVSIPATRARWQIKASGPAGIDLIQ